MKQTLFVIKVLKVTNYLLSSKHLMNCVQQRPSGEADASSAIEEIPGI